MADNKRWFKVWTSILTDPGMQLLHNPALGMWVRLGALVAEQGEKGKVSLSNRHFTYLTHLDNADEGTVNALIDDLKKVHVIIEKCRNEMITVTFLKWHKYQVDNSAGRVAKYRQNVTVQEEKRREEKRIRREENKDVGSKGFEPSSFFEELKQNPAYKGLDIEREFHKLTQWCKTNKKVPTERRFINWLNRADKPLLEKENKYAKYEQN